MRNSIVFFLLLAFSSIAIAESALTKEIESLYYRGRFQETNFENRKLIYQEALDLSEKNIKNLEEKTERKDLFSLPVSEQVVLLKKIPDSQEVLFWATITWGVWGMTFGDLRAALNDVAGKCARYSELLIEIDPTYRDGAGYRLLGRLHTLVPKIPFFTNWIDREYGIQLLHKAVTISTKDLRNELFLGEALYKYEPGQKQFALELIRRVASQKGSEDNLEERETIEQAKSLLNELD